MRTHHRLLAAIFAVGPAGLALAACGSGTSPPATGAEAAVPAPPKAVGPATAAVDIPGEDRFAPFVVDVAPKGVITITNHDTDAHTVTSVPGSPVPFDITVEPNGGSKTLQLPAGVYRFYCTTHAKWDEKTSDVAALPSANFPDEPMEGVFVVG